MGGGRVYFTENYAVCVDRAWLEYFEMGQSQPLAEMWANIRWICADRYGIDRTVDSTCLFLDASTGVVSKVA